MVVRGESGDLVTYPVIEVWVLVLPVVLPVVLLEALCVCFGTGGAVIFDGGVDERVAGPV